MINQNEIDAYNARREQLEAMQDLKDQEILAEEAVREQQQVKAQQEQKRQQRRGTAFSDRKRPEPAEPDAIARAAQDTKAVKPEREDGFFTQLGELGESIISGGVVKDGLNALAAGVNQITPEDSPLKPATQAVDDFILSQEEIDANFEQQISERLASDDPAQHIRGSAQAVLMAGEKGSTSGLLSPLTLGGRVTGQATPWSYAPEAVKQSPVADAVFQIAEVAVPGLMLPGGGGVLRTVGTLAVESAFETAVQTETIDDTIQGRKVAEAMGRIAETMGYDGAKLTAELVEGKTFTSQAFVATLGFLQNMGINWGTGQAVKYFSDLKGVEPPVTEEVQAAARALGQDPKKVAEAVADTNQPNYSVLEEPSESMTPGTVVPTAKPSKGNEYISDEALVTEAMRRNGLDPEGLTTADRNYFSNIDAVTTEEGAQAVLREATRTLKRLGPAKKDIDVAVTRAASWWDSNKKWLDEDFRYFVEEYESGMTKFLDDEIGYMDQAFRPNILDENRQTWIENTLKDRSQTTTEGFIVTPLIIEEMAIRTQKLARQAANLDNAATPIDFTKPVENLIEMTEKMELFIVPLRRGKRRSSVDFSVQQQKTIKRLKDADITRGAEDPTSAYQSRKELTGIQGADGDYRTLREYWELAKAGDTEALQTVKAYINTVAYSAPGEAAQNVDKLNRILAEQFKQGKKNAVANIHYGMMLSGTQTHLASLSSNLFRLVGDPLGAIVSGQRAYGFGQLKGGLASASAGLKNIRTAWIQNAPITSGQKIDAEIYNLKARQTKLDSSYQGMVREMNANGASDMEKFGARIWYEIQTAGNHPLVNSPGRALMAMDEGVKTVFAGQVAGGRAQMRFAEAGNTRSLESLIKEETNKVFADGVRTGKITDGEVLDAAKALTFQSDIPSNGNMIDDVFFAVDSATKKSGVLRFVSPFTRVSYNMLESYARVDPILGEAFRRMVPKYQKILNGDMGLVAQQQLKSQIAIGRLSLLGITGFAMAGNLTGYNSGNMPQTSFIIPMPDGSYKAFDYSRIEPFASMVSFWTDVVQALRDDVISEGQYERAFSNVLYSLGMSTLDKSFMSGLTNFAGLLDPESWGIGTISNATGIGGSLIMPAAARQIMGYVQPYQTNTTHKNNPLVTFINKARGRLFNGIGNPVKYSEFSGKPIPRVATIGDSDNYWRAVGAAVLRDTVYPGQVKDAGEDPNFRIPRDRKGFKDFEVKGELQVRAVLSAIGYEHDDTSSLETFMSVALSPTQQSRVQKVMGTQGILLGALEDYFNSPDFREDWISYNENRWKNPTGYQGEGSASAAFLTTIVNDVRSRYREAKQDAVWEALSDDPEFTTQYDQLHAKVDVNNKPVDGGLYAWSNGDIGIVDIDYEAMMA